jgi:hypothetical protein
MYGMVGVITGERIMKFDDYVQCEDGADMVVYEEWAAYVEEVGQERAASEAEWRKRIGWEDCLSQ